MEFNVSPSRCILCSYCVYVLINGMLICSFSWCQEVLKSTRTQLERELVLEDVLEVKDLPSYTMLDK